MSATTESSAGAAVRPFTVPVASGEEVQELRSRVAATRWPDAETVKDHSQGVQLETAQELASYWASDYDWRSCEAKLGRLPCGDPLHARLRLLRQAHHSWLGA
jgi:hypothetical protein